MTHVAERWTPERRREHTRDVLLDAAEQVFAERGFEAASLEEIAEVAGYSRGAIYKNFGNKEELFIAANKRFNERFLSDLREVGVPTEEGDTFDLAVISKRWRDVQSRVPRPTLGQEFSLYLLRNPQVRRRVAHQRRETTEMVARYIEDRAQAFGVTLRIPALTLARVVLATSDGLNLASQLDPDDEDLYEPFLELLTSALEFGEQPKPSSLAKGPTGDP